MARTLKDYLSVALKAEDLDGKIDFFRIFGRRGPVHVEIGTGKAAFLLKEAKAQPDANFFGIERASRYYRYAIDRIGRWGLTNVRIIRTDAVYFLTDFVPDSSVDCFHIYFPDPWPKKRHHKRRFFCPANMQQLLRALKTGSDLKIVTDHAEYFKVIKGLTETESKTLEEIEFIRPAGSEVGEWVGTNFERKYLKQNIPIYTLAVRKI
ncbi:MAG TPA: tRNA (guanosine(46)-N7)-methyltransferase TrmB [Sedimentisphaerales bacterium]|nr:tRNA (guanosine(46)-N7)-methyltransferase TrmB [Sedimentisphaerales bacterium]